MKKFFFIISGISGPNRTGNQSLRNTILGYLRHNYEVYHFTALREKDRKLDFTSLLNHTGYHHYGMLLLSIIFFLGSNIKKMRKRKGRESPKIPKPTEKLDLGLSEITGDQAVFSRIYSIVETFRVFRNMLIRKPDVIYGYEIYGCTTASVLGRFFKIKTILRFQGTYLTEKNKFYKVMQYHIKKMKGYNNGIVMANDGTKGRDLLISLGIPADKILFLANGLDDRIMNWNPDYREIKYLRKQLDINDSYLVLGIFNRFYPYKRIDRAFYFAKTLLEKGLKVKLIVGGGQGPLEERLKQLVGDLGITQSVKWLGQIPYEKMPLYYNAVDIVLLMNDYANTGNQILECAKMKIPVIAIDDDNNSKLFSDCPYILFKRVENFLAIDGEEIEKICKSREETYISKHLLSWLQRMDSEINWIESRKMIV